jgi:hypothetical protein
VRIGSFKSREQSGTAVDRDKASTTCAASGNEIISVERRAGNIIRTSG